MQKKLVVEISAVKLKDALKEAGLDLTPYHIQRILDLLGLRDGERVKHEPISDQYLRNAIRK